MPAAELPITADQGSVFDLGVAFTREGDSSITDLSSGWSARFVVKDSLGANAAQIEDLQASTDPTKVVLSDGSTGSNLDIHIPSTDTKAWNPDPKAYYEILVWPTASPEEALVLVKGPMRIRKGLT